MLSLKAKIAASGLLAAAAVASGVGATPANAATETVTVTIQVTHNSVSQYPSVVYRIMGERYYECSQEGTPTLQVVAPLGATISLVSTSGCYSGAFGGEARVAADATKTVQVSL
jgi:hypothetical protein